MGETVTRYDDDMTRIMQDPALWAEYHLKQKPRWYQEQILRHPHNRIVLRCGRRLGKCIEGSQRILNADTGAYESVASLYEKQIKHTPLYSLQEDYTFAKTKSFFIEDNGIKPVFRVQVKHGAEVVLTGNHPVLTIDGWKEVDALRVGEFIAVPKSLPVFGKDSPGLNRAKMAGYLVGGLTQTKKGPILNISAKEVVPVIAKTAAEVGVSIHKKTDQNYFFHDQEKQFLELIEEKETGLPKEIFTYDKTHLAVFLAALYDTNGWAYKERIAEIGYGSRNHEQIKEIKHLLLRFGIDANIVRRILAEKPYYQLMIYAKKQVISFVDQIGLYAAKDYSEVKAFAETMSERETTLPPKIWEYIEKERVAKGMKKYEVTGNKAEKFRKNVGLTEEKAKRYAENLQYPFLYDLARSDIYWEEVISIVPEGEKQTYDVFVPETHNLIVEDILVHNTWTMVAHMLWVAFTCNGGKDPRGATCVVATPYDTQARLIYNELIKFIDDNEVLSSSVKSRTKNPYFIEFNNGSQIKLFTAGPKSGSGGGSLRGQKATWLYMDKPLSLYAVMRTEKLCEFKET